MEVGRVAQDRQRSTDLGQRQRQHALDLGRVDRHRSRGEVLTQELLGQKTAERVPDDDRLGIKRADDLGEVRYSVVDAGIGNKAGVLASCMDGVGLPGPARGDRLISGISVQIEPPVPAGGVQPQAVDKDDGSA